MEGEGGSSSNNNSNNPSRAPNSGRNNGKAPLSAPPTAPSGSSQNATPSPRPPSGRPPPSPSSLWSRVQDRYLPSANVVRIMRRALPTHAKISDDAKETVQECASEFIAFVTEEANQKCREDNRKSITSDDLIYAMTKLGFDNYVEPMKLCLQKYRDHQSIGLGKSELASRQRRYTNRAAAIQIQEPVAGIEVMPYPAPAVMPQYPMFSRQHMPLSPFGNPGHINAGSGTSSGANAGFNSTAGVGGGQQGPTQNSNPNPNPNPSMNVSESNDELGDFDNIPSPPSPTPSNSEMGFFELFNEHFK